MGPEDFDTATLTIPNDSRLPNAGAPITLVDKKPDSIRLPDRVTTGAGSFGGESRNWQGFDFTLDARLRDVLFQGGVSTGAFSTDRCAQLAALPENLDGESSPDFCSTDQAWLTQVKFLTSYTLPYDIQIAATFQNQQGPERLANVTFTDAEISAALGRPSVFGSQTVNVIPPGTVYGERYSQLDLRFTKIFTFAGGHAAAHDVRYLQPLQRECRDPRESRVCVRRRRAVRQLLVDAAGDHAGAVGEVRVPIRLLGGMDGGERG